MSPRDDREEQLALATRLAEARPVPRSAFRSAVRSRLLGRAAATRTRVAGLILGYATSGALLLIIAAVGLIGIGPFAT
jgi:hypothetical protein